ncbi:GGDEF domain-containing protein [Actinoplanes sp. NPDC051346]|uniref:GGDEF domain-containing protein n=1 Tax=Actinoplanes sp. NPDC051346 TaxID=3155048 RepID=UPI00343C99D4
MMVSRHRCQGVRPGPGPVRECVLIRLVSLALEGVHRGTIGSVRRRRCLRRRALAAVGEEFVLVLPGVDADESVRRCERLRRSIAGHAWRPITGDLPVTASIGVTTVADGASTPSALLAAADRNLYAAKRSGRNRVVADPA